MIGKVTQLELGEDAVTSVIRRGVAAEFSGLVDAMKAMVEGMGSMLASERSTSISGPCLQLLPLAIFR